MQTLNHEEKGWKRTSSLLTLPLEEASQRTENEREFLSDLSNFLVKETSLRLDFKDLNPFRAPGLAEKLTDTSGGGKDAALVALPDGGTC